MPYYDNDVRDITVIHDGGLIELQKLANNSLFVCNKEGRSESGGFRPHFK